MQILIHLDIIVFVLPMLKEQWSDWPVVPTSEKCQDWAVRCRGPTYHAGNGVGFEVYLRKRDVFARVESF